MDFFAQDPVDPWGVIGPQTDGTVLIAPTGQMAQPADTAGGQPAQYGQQVLDIFKFGIGALVQDQSLKRQLDYRRYEATNGGLYQAGQPATMARTATGGISNLTLLIIGGVIAFALLTNKG